MAGNVFGQSDLFDENFTSDEEGSAYEGLYQAQQYEDRNTLDGPPQSLGLSENYVPGWDTSDAFREFYQNWFVNFFYLFRSQSWIGSQGADILPHRKDSMIDSSSIADGKLKITVKDTNSFYIAEARHPISGALLGFIRFCIARGHLELTNFKAKLSRKALDLGTSSKRRKSNQAGTHGEGFKIASLVMVRNGYQVRYESQDHYWNFRLGGRGGRDEDHLYCHFSKMRKSSVEKNFKKSKEDRLKKMPRGYTANSWEDVTVKMGNVSGPNNGEKITREIFMEWVKVALDLNKPSTTIEIPQGTIILDPSSQGKIYLKGLLLQDASSSKFKYGYNFLHGQVNRDRQKLSSSEQEAKMLVEMWNSAIELESGSRTAVKNYVDMLTVNTEWADVEKAGHYISKFESLAKSIFEELERRDSGKNRFYYPQDSPSHVSFAQALVVFVWSKNEIGCGTHTT
jgi:hypothetical protein